MAPRTRTRQRKERRKWMRSQQNLQQKKHQDQDFPRGPTPSPNTTTKDTESHGLKSITDQEPDENITGKGEDSVTTTHGSEFPIGTGAPGGDEHDYDDLNGHNNHQQLHPPDCICILRKQSRGKNFFLPPPSLSSAMEEADDYYCLEISSTNHINRKK